MAVTAHSNFALKMQGLFRDGKAPVGIIPHGGAAK